MVSGGEVKSLIARPVSRRFYFLKREFVWPRLRAPNPQPLCFPETNLRPMGKRDPFTARGDATSKAETRKPRE